MARLVKLATGIVCMAALAGCAADVHEVRMQRPVILRTNKDERVYLDVRNASAVQDFPIDGVMRDSLRSKGYTLVDRAADADVELRVLVAFCGLEKEAFKSDKVVGGALVGAGAGALSGAAAKGGSSSVALGGLIGAILGAGGGALTEHWSHKNTFVGLVKFEIDQKGKPRLANSVAARVRERKLTLERAAQRIATNVGEQIAGLF